LESLALCCALLTVGEVDSFRWLPAPYYSMRQRQQAGEFATWAREKEKTAWGHRQREWWSQAVEEAEALRWAWFRAELAAWPLLDIRDRQEHRRSFRELIGEENYWRQQWPPPVPWWRLPRWEDGDQTTGDPAARPAQ
jgi:hypothetical protein